MEPTGIVILAGGPVYFLNAYVNCVMLRHMGCNLPIEWFYLGKEMKPEWLEEVSKIEGVTLVDLGGDQIDNTKERGGWQNKVNAVLCSSFHHVLFLDADCFPLRDPSFLFEHDFYKSTGCVLFQDPFEWRPDQLARLKDIFGVDLPARQVESGQMLFNKARCMDGLLACQELNQNSQETYKHLFGDKDTFIIGMIQAGCDYKMSPGHVKSANPGGMIHDDFDGIPLFFHTAGYKWRLHGRSMMRESEYPLLPKAKEVVNYLKSKYFNSVQLKELKYSRR